MAWLVDTDVLSERTRKTPNERVLSWLAENAASIYTSSHVIGELQAGISALPTGGKKRALQQWLNRLSDAMEGRVLNFNTSVATVWGQQEAEFATKGCPMPMPDSFIAATARRHNLTNRHPKFRRLRTSRNQNVQSIQLRAQFMSDSHSRPEL